jgi:Ni/Fe-hydrogenase subunit HybB-like protein
MSVHAERYEPVGGRLFTAPFIVLSALSLMGIAFIVWRFANGIGSVTALNDGYPWGLWITMDVVVGTALACGGYAVAILVYFLNRRRYHPLMRSAIVTSALGYTLGGFGVLLDLGRYYNVYQLPFFWNWNLHSVLLEVALCITTYVVVLWIELSPAILEKASTMKHARLRSATVWVKPKLETALPFLIALGMLLPTMHQSSLGSLMMLAGYKLHPLWQTPYLPLLFLLSCLAMGYAIVVIESSISTAAFKRASETHLLGTLGLAAAVAMWLYVGIRLFDVVRRGLIGAAFTGDRHGILFLVEMLLFIAAATLLSVRGLRRRGRWLFRAAALAVLAGGLYRFSTFLIAFDPGRGWKYFPALTEILTTVGLFSLEILAYIVFVKYFPILPAAELPAQTVPLRGDAEHAPVATQTGA